MKKLLKWVFPAFLGIMPAFGTEGSIAEVTDPFFVRLGTSTSSLVWINETAQGKDGKIKMTIEGQDGSDSRTLPVEPTCKVVGSVGEDDETKTYQEVVEASIKCGDQILTEKLTRTLRVPYPSQESETNMKAGSPLRDFELSLGETVDLRKETIFTRPSDKAELKKRGGPAGQAIVRGLFKDQEITTAQQFLGLGVPSITVYKTKLVETDTRTTEEDAAIYELVLKTKISPVAGAFYHCVDHNFSETSFKGLKKVTQQRCCHGTYEKFSENLQVWKRSFSGEEALVYNDPTVTKVKLFLASRQQRGPGNQNVPVQHCIDSGTQHLPATPPHEIVAVKPISN